ncbi:MAG TPA: hypothetical protein VJ841_03530 [Candidatus Saccharimonadales bacterium]|nr:hypothetical protein [Candidatus Saccharimonadales bacterium]
MSKEEVLRTAIIRAINNGFCPLAGITAESTVGIYPSVDSVVFIYERSGWVGSKGLDVFRIIFDRSFAKALWGDEEAGDEDFYAPKHDSLSGSYWRKMWEYHLRNMAISEDPIKYLEGNM